MEVLMSSSRSSCRRTALMLKTILLWFCPSEDAPNRAHLCFPVRVKSHITISPLGLHKHTQSHTHSLTHTQVEHVYGEFYCWWIVNYTCKCLCTTTLKYHLTFIVVILATKLDTCVIIIILLFCFAFVIICIFYYFFYFPVSSFTIVNWFIRTQKIEILNYIVHDHQQKKCKNIYTYINIYEGNLTKRHPDHSRL